MEAEIVFSGLCSFLNLRAKNPTMPGPSVVVIRADPAAAKRAAELSGIPVQGPPVGVVGENGAVVNEVLPEPEHIPYIAFDSKKVAVDDGHPFVPSATRASFRLLRLDGDEISIVGVPPGMPVVDPSYDKVVSKDAYWPEAKNLWNRDLVPDKDDRPKASAVVGFMRFGEGNIRADRISPFQFLFTRNDGSTLIDNFAEDVIYSGFPHPESEVILHLWNLETGNSRDLHFTPLPGQDRVTIFVGNIESDGMDDVFDRKVRVKPTGGRHVSFLNLVADSKQVTTHGPVAEPVIPPVTAQAGGTAVEQENAGGGGTSGFCGPGNANGS